MHENRLAQARSPTTHCDQCTSTDSVDWRSTLRGRGDHTRPTCYQPRRERASEQQPGRQPKARRRYCLLLLGCALLLPPFVRGDELSDTRRFLAGLRERRLYALGAYYCRQQLGREGLPPRSRARFTIELARCYAEQAMDLRPGEREPMWEAAREVVRDFLAKEPDNPRTVLIRFQDALTLLAQGEQLRMEAEMTGAGPDALEKARASIRQAERALEELLAELASLAARPPTQPDPEALSADERMSFGQNVRHQRARALRNLAQTYPRRSADRIAALQKALQQLREALSLTTGTPPLYWELRLDEVVCQRLLEDWNQVGECLAAFPQQDVPADALRRIHAETVRYALATSGPERALAKLQTIPQGAEPRSAELDFARLETAIALWRAAADKKVEAEAAKWRDQAVARVRDIERRHGGYWGRRADLLLLETGRDRGSGSTEILERAANEFYIQGRFEAALSGYDEAAAASRAAGDDAKAFELAYKAALVEQNQSHYELAAKRFRELALAAPEAEHAANAHLLAIANLAQQARHDAALAETYADTLQEHLRLWPAGPTAATAWLWLGKLHESHSQWAEAVQAYRQAGAVQPTSSEALEGLTCSWLRWLEELQAAERIEETRQIAEEAADYLESTAQKLREGDPHRADGLILQAARLRFAHTLPDYVRLEKTLRPVTSSDADQDTSSEARRMLVLALAGQPGRELEAISAIPAGLSADEVVLSGLAALAEEAADEGRRGALARMLLQLCEAADKSTADDPQRMRWTPWRARALEHLGRRTEAIELLRRVATQFPEDLVIQEALGSTLLRGRDTESAAQALDQWRKIAAHCPPRSNAWFRAKYHVALAQFRTGDKEGAARLIRYVQLTEDLKSSGWQAQFEELLSHCQR